MATGSSPIDSGTNPRRNSATGQAKLKRVASAADGSLDKVEVSKEESEDKSEVTDDQDTSNQNGVTSIPRKSSFFRDFNIWSPTAL